MTLLLLLLLLSGAIRAGANTTAPAITLTVCGHNQAQNSETFDVSFVKAMELIYPNITTSGFGASVSGNGSNTVYGLGQCFDYLSSLGCSLCYAQSRVKLPGCLPAVDSRVYLEGCFLRYSDHNVSGDATDASDATVCGNSTLASLNSTGPRNYLTEFVKNLTDGAAAGGGGNYSRYYKADSVVLPTAGGETVYGMAQCWKSLNASACGDCLKAARESVVGCVPASDGKALNAGCYLRYSTDPFYLVDLAEGGGGSSSARRRRLAVALGATFIVLVVIGIAVFLVRRRGSRDSNHEQYGSTEIIRTIAASHLSYKYEDIIKATDGFNQINKLGQGGYGSVYKGVLQDGREIAVKRLFINTRQWIDQFFNEVTLINQVQHKNLVKLIGCSVEGPESLLIYEYLCNTSLEKFLFDSFKKSALDWERRFDIIVGTAEGLAYLHGASEIRIIHRDIKASNILLDEKFKPKISDFGLARYFAEDQSHLSTGLAGTFGYMAPEYIVHGQLTEKADVYSYGVLVLEIITGRKNQNSVSTSTEGHSLIASIWQHFSSKTVGELLDPNLQDQCSEEQALRVFHVGLLCVQASPSLRPPMWKVVEMLTGGSKDLPLPTQPPFINVKGTGSSGEGSEASYATSSSKSPFSMNQLSISVSEGRQVVDVELDSSDNQRLNVTDDKERGKTQISIRPRKSQPHR